MFLDFRGYDEGVGVSCRCWTSDIVLNYMDAMDVDAIIII